MSGPDRALEQVLSALDQEHPLPADWRRKTAAVLEQMEETPPWYVRAMVGAGAWLASLLLIAFVTGVNLVTSDVAFVITGALLILGATVARRRLTGDFFHQAALATSLAGQVLLAYGVSEVADWNEFEALCYTLIVTNCVLVAIYPDRIHRFLSVLVVVGSLVGLIYLREQQWLLAGLAPLLAVAWMVLLSGRGRALVADTEIRGPVMAGSMIGAFAVVMLSTLYLLPELAGDFTFYPNPWVSTLLFGVLLGFAEHRVLTNPPLSPAKRVMPVVYLLTSLIILASLQAPGIVYALLVMLLGAGLGRKLTMSTGVVFLVIFLGAYLYGIDTSLLTKSWTLMGTGLVLLTGRQLLLAVWPRQEGEDHA